MQSLDFSDALKAIKSGKRVARSGWNGKGQFVFMIPGSVFKVNRAPLMGIFEEGHEITYRPHIALCGVDGAMQEWVPSSGDLFANDWSVVE